MIGTLRFIREFFASIARFPLLRPITGASTTTLRGTTTAPLAANLRCLSSLTLLMWRSMYAPLARPMRNAAAVALGATVLSSAAARDHVGSVALPVARAEGVGGSGGRPRDSSSMEDADGFFSHIENCRKRACSDPDATRSALLQALRSRKPPGAQGSAAGAADGGAHGGAGAAPSAGPVDGGDGEVEDGATDDDIAPDAQQLGRATWTLLHAMADSYPERPSAETQADATRFFHFLSRRYPCGTCAADFRAEIAKDPPA